MKEFIHHLFVPCHSNNHRAKLLHHKSLVFVILFLLVSQFLLSTIKTNFQDILGTATSITFQELLAMTNKKRAENGLKPLTMNDQLSYAASLKAKHMFDKNYWAHNAPDGTTPWVFIKSSGYTYIYAGENLARGFTTSSGTVDAWMASPLHKQNILSGNYEEIGFAIEDGKLLGEDTTLVVEMFGSRTQPALARNKTTPQAPVVPSQAPANKTIPQVAKKPSVAQSNLAFGASDISKPLIDSRFLTKSISTSIVLLFISILILDMIIIERKKIARLVGHNIDHILFLGVILIFILLFGRGVIL